MKAVSNFKSDVLQRRDKICINSCMVADSTIPDGCCVVSADTFFQVFKYDLLKIYMMKGLSPIDAYKMYYNDIENINKSSKVYQPTHGWNFVIRGRSFNILLINSNIRGLIRMCPNDTMKLGCDFDMDVVIVTGNIEEDSRIMLKGENDMGLYSEIFVTEVDNSLPDDLCIVPWRIVAKMYAIDLGLNLCKRLKRKIGSSEILEAYTEDVQDSLEWILKKYPYIGLYSSNHLAVSRVKVFESNDDRVYISSACALKLGLDIDTVMIFEIPKEYSKKLKTL